MASTYSLVLITLCSLIYFNDGVKANCGGLIERSHGTITSPGYPQNYPSDQDCLWEIKGPPNKNIWFHFKDIHLEITESCAYDSVTIRTKKKDGTIREHGKFCNSSINNFNISKSNILYIYFKSDRSTEYKGFEMDFYIVPFEGHELHDESEGIITSPRYPFPYPPSLNYTWDIHVPHNHFIKLNVERFETEVSSECVQEYVAIQSKMADGEIRHSGKFCGRKDPFVILSESNMLQVEFVSHNNKENRGFKAKYISGECGGLIEEGKGNISSLFFPDLYPPNTVCEWSFLVPPQHKIKLNFKEFEIEDGNNCPNDFLQVQGESREGIIFDFGKYCGHFGPSKITSKDRINLKFVSDRSIEGRGFMVEYIIDKLTVFESSVSSEKSTFLVNEATTIPAYEITTTPVYEATTTPFYETTTTSPVYETTTTTFYETTTTTPDHDATTIPDDDTKDFVTSEKEKIIFSDMQILKKKVADLEEMQKMIINNYENMFKKVSRLLSSKNASFVEKALHFN